MRVLSLCSGYGGLDLAVEAHHDARLVAWSEIDPHASTVMRERFPDAAELGDFTVAGAFDALRGGDPKEPAADIVCAGFPTDRANPCRWQAVARAPRTNGG